MRAIAPTLDTFGQIQLGYSPNQSIDSHSGFAELMYDVAIEADKYYSKLDRSFGYI
jgi:hypothetical protein